MKPFEAKEIKKTIKVGNYTVHILENEPPSPEAIRNTNREINRLMNEKFAKRKEDA